MKIRAFPRSLNGACAAFAVVGLQASSAGGRSSGARALQLAHRFKGIPDGAHACTGLVSDGAGNFLGATVHGGTENEGGIFRFIPRVRQRAYPELQGSSVTTMFAVCAAATVTVREPSGLL